MTAGRNDRDIAATVIRSVAAGTTIVAKLDPDPSTKVAADGAAELLGLVASLVQNVGRGKAEEILRQLVEHPARPITDDELKADVERIKAEFGV